ncbi:MAG: O-antigen ligase family protein [Flavitalea sp.]
MGEPFFLALALTPAIAYYMMSFKKTWKENKFRLTIIFLCYIVTYSSIAVTGFVLSVFFALYFNDYFNIRKNRLVLAPFLIVPIVLIVNFAINNVQLINARFTDTSALFLSSELKTSEVGRANASTFALYSNYIIARDSFLKDPLFGSGLGSHPLIYKETFLKYFPSLYLDRYGSQNQQDANSKFLRLMSETGIIGLFLFLFIFFRFFASKKKMITNELKELGAINYSIFVYIFLCLIRNGNYINIGFFLFLFLYYLTWKIINFKYASLYESSLSN